MECLQFQKSEKCMHFFKYCVKFYICACTFTNSACNFTNSACNFTNRACNFTNSACTFTKRACTLWLFNLMARHTADHMRLKAHTLSLDPRCTITVQYIQCATDCDNFGSTKSLLNFRHVKNQAATGGERLRPCNGGDHSHNSMLYPMFGWHMAIRLKWIANLDQMACPLEHNRGKSTY